MIAILMLPAVGMLYMIMSVGEDDVVVKPKAEAAKDK